MSRRFKSALRLQLNSSAIWGTISDAPIRARWPFPCGTSFRESVYQEESVDMELFGGKRCLHIICVEL